MDGIAALRALEEKHGTLPPTLMAESPSGSVHYYWKLTDGVEISCTTSAIAPGVDIKGEGGMVMAPPSVRADGVYRWLNELEIAEPPAWLVQLAIAASRKRKEKRSNPPHAIKDPWEAERFAAAVADLPNPNLDWENWNRLIMAIYFATGGSNEGLKLAHTWSMKSKSKYDADATDDKWHDLHGCPPTDIGAGTIYFELEKYDPGWRQRYEDSHPRPGTPDDGGHHARKPPEFTEDAIALRFAEQHAGDLRYVAEWGKWFRWTGNRWEEEKTLYVFDLAKVLCREDSARCNKPSVSKMLASAKTRAAVVSMAREDRRIAATIDQWDTDLWLLNTPGGVVDLRTGTLRAHRPEDYMTRITAVAPGGDCPMFLSFLDTITTGDKELQAYLQRAFGYALTGSVKEHAMFFGYGIGSNGKSTLMNTVAHVVGDYYSAASMDTFIVTVGDRHPADLAALRGARLVVASETEEGRRWAEARIRQLTGDDPISARFMRQDYFTYHPQFKLFFMGNHKPGLRTVNVAIRRRFNLIPFGVVIPEKHRRERCGRRSTRRQDRLICSARGWTRSST